MFTNAAELQNAPNIYKSICERENGLRNQLNKINKLQKENFLLKQKLSYYIYPSGDNQNRAHSSKQIMDLKVLLHSIQVIVFIHFDSASNFRYKMMLYVMTFN